MAARSHLAGSAEGPEGVSSLHQFDVDHPDGGGRLAGQGRFGHVGQSAGWMSCEGYVQSGFFFGANAQYTSSLKVTLYSICGVHISL